MFGCVLVNVWVIIVLLVVSELMKGVDLLLMMVVCEWFFFIMMIMCVKVGRVFVVRFICGIVLIYEVSNDVVRILIIVKVWYILVRGWLRVWILWSMLGVYGWG